jgi:hypothetical protein
MTITTYIIQGARGIRTDHLSIDASAEPFAFSTSDGSGVAITTLCDLSVQNACVTPLGYWDGSRPNGKPNLVGGSSAKLATCCRKCQTHYRRLATN